MEKKEKQTKTQLQWKILRFIVVSYIVVFITAGIIKHYTREEIDISTKIGHLEPHSISIKDSLNVNLYGIGMYVNYLKNNNYEEAYSMLTEEYREVFNYEDFLQSIDGIDFETFRVESLKMKAEGTYVADVSYDRNNEKKFTQYLVYVNPYNSEKMTISPNKFIYSYSDLKFEKDQIEVILKECYIYTDSIKMSVLVKNKSLFKTMEFIDLGIGYGDTISQQNDIELILEPGEENIIEAEYDVNYYVPNNIKIKRNLNDKKLRTYTFYFDEGEKNNK